jgi:hypothetical protein
MSSAEEAQQPVDRMAKDIASTWHDDLGDEAQDIYTLDDVQPVISKDEDPS